MAMISYAQNHEDVLLRQYSPMTRSGFILTSVRTIPSGIR